MIEANAIQSIFDEVAEEAALRNGEVVQAAFDVCGITCACCEYPRNVDQFERYLLNYIDVCRNLHKVKRKYLRLCNSIDELSDPVIANHERLLKEVKISKDHWQEKIDLIRPCQICKQRYNPTQRAKYGPRQRPQKKEYLSVG
jgi:hypothetical protein